MSIIELLFELTEEVDEQFAHDVELLFLKGERVDPNRKNYRTKAVLKAEDGESSPVSGGTTKGWNTAGSTQKHFAFISKSSYAGPVIQKGDKLKVWDRPGQPIFSIKSAFPFGSGRLQLELGSL